MLLRMSAVMPATVLETPIAAPPPRRRLGDRTLYAVLTALVLAAWWVSTRGYWKSSDDVGYWLGVTGATMMLVLFSYPLRKHFRFAHRWGRVKWWFAAHMVLGIGGPLLILLHSTFHLRSLNATIALASMLIVAGSGVVGRFLYLRIHRDLQGRKDNLADLQRKAGLAEGEVRSRFRFAPEVAQRLLAFESSALAGSRGWTLVFRRVVVLPIRERHVYRQCRAELTARLRVIAREHNWTRDHARRRRRHALRLTRQYLQAVVRVGQFAAYERLFALWHVLHVPFVILLVITAIFHIFAVHAY
jgi:hypothetical protein